MKITLWLLLLQLSLSTGCMASSETTAKTEAAWEAEGVAALSNGDYAKAVEMVMSKARAGDSEAQFSVGYFLLEWLTDPNRKDPPKHSAKDALVWIYKAARSGVPQAAGVLSSAYRFGDFTLPKNTELDECWSQVEIGEQPPDICLALEANLSER